MNSPKYIALTCALLSTSAVPALASADPTVNSDRPCYVPGQEQHITVTADGAGNIDAHMKTPDLASSDDTQETVNLAASDDEPPGSAPPALGATQFLSSTFDAIVPPWDAHKVSPRKKSTFFAYGFEAVGGKTLYAHYVLHGKLLKTVAIGRLTGPCGDLKKTARQFPFRPVKAGAYKVKLDATKSYPNHSQGYTYKHVKVSKKRAVR
jgi:hypothetical protein